jgi:hypothetical protein
VTNAFTETSSNSTDRYSGIIEAVKGREVKVKENKWPPCHHRVMPM